MNALPHFLQCEEIQKVDLESLACMSFISLSTVGKKVQANLDWTGYGRRVECCIGAVTVLALIEDQRWIHQGEYIWNSWQEYWPRVMRKESLLKQASARVKRPFQKEVKVMPLDVKVRGITSCWQGKGSCGWRSQAAHKRTKEHMWWVGRRVRVTEEQEWEEKATTAPSSGAGFWPEEVVSWGRRGA